MRLLLINFAIAFLAGLVGVAAFFTLLAVLP